MKGKSSNQKAHKSNWKSIIIIGVKEYKLDESGSLIEKFEKKKLRRNLFRKSNNTRISVPKVNTTEPNDNTPAFSEMNTNTIQDPFPHETNEKTIQNVFLPETDETVQYDFFEDVECNFHLPDEIDSNNYFEEFYLDFI